MSELHGLALDWLRQHRDQHLTGNREHLIARCAEHLSNEFEVALRTARIAALNAMGELVAEPRGWRVDFTNTTRDCLFLVNVTTGQSLACPIADIPVPTGPWMPVSDAQTP